MRKEVEVYYRKITERLPQGVKKSAKKHIKPKEIAPHVGRYFVIVLTLALVILAIILIAYYFKYLDVQERRRQARDNFFYWEAVVKANPNFPDGYYNAAIYSIELREYQKAEDNLNKAIALDPSFTRAKELERKIPR